jgi:5,10-methenyltetrahydrofolate synthetase
MTETKIFLPQDKNSDPIKWAQKFKDKCKNKKVCILIPGKRFDKYGTRHGRGKGWYDRFLSKVPNDWLRIGVANKNQMSETKLKKEKWDEVMDRLVVWDDYDWKIFCIK